MPQPMFIPNQKQQNPFAQMMPQMFMNVMMQKMQRKMQKEDEAEALERFKSEKPQTISLGDGSYLFSYHNKMIHIPKDKAPQLGELGKFQRDLDASLKRKDITPAQYHNALQIKLNLLAKPTAGQNLKPPTTAMSAFLRNNPNATATEIAAYSQRLKGKGIKTTLPDGTVIEIGGGATEDKAVKRDFTNTEIAVKQFVSGLDRLQTGVNKEQSVLGPLGRSIQFLDSAVNQVGLTVKVLTNDGVVKSTPDFLNEVKADTSKWEKWGIRAAKGAVHKSNLVNLAYLLARKNERGGRITEADFERAMQTIGGMTGSPKQFNAIIDNLRKTAKSDFAIEYKVRKGKSLSGGFFGKAPPSSKTGITEEDYKYYREKNGWTKETVDELYRRKKQGLK